MNQETKNIVLAVIAEYFKRNIEEVQPECSFAEDFGADSLDSIELVLELEHKLKIHISDETAEKIKTVQDALNAVESVL